MVWVWVGESICPTTESFDFFFYIFYTMYRIKPPWRGGWDFIPRTLKLYYKNLTNAPEEGELNGLQSQTFFVFSIGNLFGFLKPYRGIFNASRAQTCVVRHSECSGSISFFIGVAYFSVYSQCGFEKDDDKNYFRSNLFLCF